MKNSLAILLLVVGIASANAISSPVAHADFAPIDRSSHEVNHRSEYDDPRVADAEHEKDMDMIYAVGGCVAFSAIASAVVLKKLMKKHAE